MEIILIFVSGIAGILIGQMNGFFERRYEKRKALNRALSELLEIRHRFKGAMYIINTLAQEIKVPYQYYDEVISGLPDGLLWDEKISGRYNEAIDVIAMHAPILAYMLRSKDIVGLFCNGTPVKFGETQESHGFALSTIALMESAMVPALEDSIESLATLLGEKQAGHVIALISETQEVPAEVKQHTNQIIENFMAVIESVVNEPVHRVAGESDL